MKSAVLIAWFGIGLAAAESLEATAKRFDEALTDIIARADQRMDDAPLSVMNKTGVAPSGDKHDYLSLSPYHWPDPDKPDGVPYVFRDGEVNPEARTDRFDRESYFRMGDAVQDFALAYRYTGEVKYAERASTWLRTWFLDPATRMNPNFQFAQWAPGEEHGRSWGIIRGTTILDLMDAVDWIGDSDAWTSADATEWRNWLADYLLWLRTSNLGQEEARGRNNHGTWYDVQVVTLALELGEEEVAREILDAAKERRIAKQIRPDGRQTWETVRTKSWDYSTFNLDALVRLAMAGERVGVDLWRFQTDDGRGIRAAIDYLLPFATNPDAWPHKQIVPFEPDRLYFALRRAAKAYGAQGYNEALASLDGPLAAMDHLRHPDLGR